MAPVCFSCDLPLNNINRKLVLCFVGLFPVAKGFNLLFTFVFLDPFRSRLKALGLFLCAGSCLCALSTLIVDLPTLSGLFFIPLPQMRFALFSGPAGRKRSVVPACFVLNTALITAPSSPSWGFYLAPPSDIGQIWSLWGGSFCQVFKILPVTPGLQHYSRLPLVPAFC